MLQGMSIMGKTRYHVRQSSGSSIMTRGSCWGMCSRETEIPQGNSRTERYSMGAGVS